MTRKPVTGSRTVMARAAAALAAASLWTAAPPAQSQGRIQENLIAPSQATLVLAAAPTYQQLAAYWAPVISQDMDDDNYRAEYITRFDYDGDWRGNNNWNNLYRFPLPGAVHYWVSETSTHYFIGYAFFHPRDWDDGLLSVFGIDEHENDMEGILLTIKKQGSYGQFVSMVTVAHSDFYSYTDQDTPPSSPWYERVAPSHSVRSGAETIDGDVDFVADNFGFHPVVYVEAKGHGVYAVRSKVTDSPPIFEAFRVTDWRNANWSGLVYPWGSSADAWGDGILYHYEGVADAPVGVSSHDGGPHQWQIVGYDLVSLRDMWSRRYDPLTFARFGFFDGDEGSDDAASPPWGWDYHDDGPSYRGALFLDPARLVDRYFDGLGSFSLTYLGHSFQ
jgi:hypothetical protein